MKRLILLSIIISFLFSQFNSLAQETGYYNSTDGKSGTELRTALHHIIKDHQEFPYYYSKTVFKKSDIDPNNPENLILVYTGRSQGANTFGNGEDEINREHVWAKSHGGFGTEPPMGSDFHNLKPADHSVNISRSNLDFDNGGNTHAEATECYYDGDSWEPRDDVKGDIARIIFYMATRYEGGGDEIDLELVDHVDSYPAAQHGKLSTLLQWNQLDPPDEFERNRNNVIFKWQRNRNPFIDNPDFADLIWNNASPSPIIIDNITISDDINAETTTLIEATITHSTGSISKAEIHWGTTHNDLSNIVTMNQNGNNFSGNIPAQDEGLRIFYKIITEGSGNSHESVVYNYYVTPVFNGTLVSIYDIQGQTEMSPMADQIVDANGTQDLNIGEISTSGIVTGSFGDKYFIQDGKGEWNGIMVYDQNHQPNIGDSIIVTGLVKEYYTMTEMSDITGYYHIASDKMLPEPILIETGDNSKEKYESVLVKIEKGTCTDADYQSNHYMWEVNDGSGPLFIHNSSSYEYIPSEGIAYNITGPLNFDFGEYKIELRDELDVNSSSDSDIEAPTVLSVTVANSTEIHVYFNEKVDKTTAENKNNYSINNNVEVVSAHHHLLNKKRVMLTVRELVFNTNYTLNVKRVKDLNGNAITELNFDFAYGDGDGIDELSNNIFNISPNPVKDNLFIYCNNLGSSKLLTLTIHTVDGKFIKKIDHQIIKGENKFTINVSSFHQGIYIIETSIKGQIQTRKFVKY